MSDFVTPETRTLPLSGEGRSITIRRRLNYGEKTAMYARMSTTGDDGRRKVDGIKMEIGIISAYLLDWTLRGDDGAVVEIRGLSPDDLGDVINSLEPRASRGKKSPGACERIEHDLHIARLMGWRYEWVLALPDTVAEVLIAMLTREQRERDTEQDVM
jgi:hypothetical protein